MTDIKISQLPAATTPLAGTELVPIVQGGVTKKVAIGGTIPASQIINTPAGTVAATTVQAAIDEIVSDNAAPSGSSLVGYLPSGTGAVATTVQTKLRETVSVKDFGAVGDGVADDTAAIQAALTANAGKSIVFPSGATYKVTSGLTVGVGTILSLYGATINASSSHFTVFTLGSGCSVFGGTINGAGNGTANVNGNAIKAFGTNNTPSAPTYITGPVIRDVTINNIGFYGIYMQYCTSPVVQNCQINHVGYAAVVGLSCTDGVLDSNTIYDVSPGSSSNAYGLAFSRYVTALNDTTVNPRSKNCRITNNRISGVTIWEAIDTHAADGIIIANNTIDNCATGVACVASGFGGSDDIASSNVVVEGNSITLNSGLGSAIVVAGAIAGGTTVDYSDAIVISGNRIIGGGLAGNAITGSINIYSAKNVSVVGNIVKNARVTGIHVYDDIQWFTISGNTVIDPYDNTQTASCVKQSGNNVVGIVSGNTFVRNNTALGTNVANSSIRFASSTGSQVSVGKNIYAGITSTFLNFAGDTLSHVNVTQAASEKGQASLSLTSGGGSQLVDVTFTNVFPSSVPKISASISSAINVGGKAPIFRITNLTNTGFRLIAYPYDNGTWTATGTLTVEWFATT